jgi:hypothetical protein
LDAGAIWDLWMEAQDLTHSGRSAAVLYPGEKPQTAISAVCATSVKLIGALNNVTHPTPGLASEKG